MIANFTTTLFSRTKLLFTIAIIGVLALGACKKEEVDPTQYSAISVINASPTVATYDAYLGTTKLNSVALPAGGGTPYSQRVAGVQDVKFTIAGRVDNVYTKNVGLATNTYHSFFLVGRTTALEGIFTTDDLTAVSTTNAFIRFVNASPDAPALDLFVKGGNSVITNKAYKTVSGFTPILAGTYTFDIKETTSGTVKTSTESVVLGANVYYTVLVKGLNAPATGGVELPLSSQVTVNGRL